MKTTHFRTMVFCFCLFLPCTTRPGFTAIPPQRVDPEDRTSWALTDEQTVITSASRMLFGQEANVLREATFNIVAVLTQTATDRSPSVGGFFNKHTLWRVTFSCLKASANEDEKSTLFDAARGWVWDAYIDPVEGRFLKVEAARDPDAARKYMDRQPSQRSATDQMSRNGPELWTGLITTPLKISFIDAVSTIEKNGFAVLTPPTAVLVQAHCVRWSYAGADPKPVWSVHVFGTAPATHRQEVPDIAKDHLRHVVDASSGEWLMSTTVPQPDAPAEPTPKPTDEDAKTIADPKQHKQPH